ncbi:Quinone oxidoreductase 2 [Trichoderma ghanense]|uniref:Quinone oxidoreductase 2 n=1 Tax=Trichoderma ghanense TaxID=65468 RepID=A0ABY2H563_9HYPO
MSVAIFPASGGLGTATYTHLLNSKAIPASDVVLISRFPDKTPQIYQDQGVHLRQATFEDSPAALEATFKGVKTLFLISYPSHSRGYRTPLQLAALDAAHRAGVKHVFYSSLAFALPEKDTTKAEVMGTHLDTEARLREIAAKDPGFTWTSVREGLYSESTPIYTAFVDLKDPASTEIRIPHDGSGPGISWAKREELGEATAALIAQYFKDPANFPWKNKIVILTGSREWSLAETAKVLSEVAGRELTIRQVSVDDYVNQPQVLKYFGSADLARTWATAWEAIREGETAYVSPTLEELLGRRPEAFDVTVKNQYASLSAK